TRFHRLAANQHGASPAVALAAAILGPGQCELRAERPEQRLAAARRYPHGLAIQLEAHVIRHGRSLRLEARAVHRPLVATAAQMPSPGHNMKARRSSLAPPLLAMPRFCHSD